MKKLTLMLLLGINYIASMACGPSYTEEDFYHNLLNQQVLVEPSLRLFLLSTDQLLYGDMYEESASINDSKNYSDWAAYLGGNLTNKVIHDAFFNQPELAKDAFKEVTKKKREAFFDYIDFVSRIDGVTGYQDYDAIWEGKKDNGPSVEKLIEETKVHYTKANKFYKLRYGYQLTKLANSGSPEMLDKFYHNYVLPVKEDDAVFYYAQSNYARYVAFTLDNYSLAGNYYIQLFNICPEKRREAYTSLRFVTEASNMHEIAEHTTSTEEQAVIAFIQGFRKYEDPLTTYNTVYNIDKNSPYLKVLLARGINSLERKKFPRDNGYGSFHFFDCKKPVQEFEQYEYASETPFISTAKQWINKLESSQTKKDDRLKLGLAYLHLLNNNRAASNSVLSQLATSNNTDVVQFAKLGQAINYLGNLDKISSAGEKYLGTKIDLVNKLDSVHAGYWNTEGKTDYFWKIIGNKYAQQGDYVKAYLSNYNLTELGGNMQNCVLEDIVAFKQKENKNALEQALDKRLNGSIEMVYDMQSSYAIMQNDFATATSYAKKAITSKDSIVNFHNISKTIFARPELVCYDCKPETAFGKEINLPFLFIPEKMNKKELVDVLVNLEEKSSTDADAAILLGNFYNSIGTDGYYRHIYTNDGSNAVSRAYYDNINKFWDEEYHPYYGGTVISIAPNTAINYFSKAMLLTNNKEIKAKAVWGKALADKASLNQTIYHAKTWEDSYERSDYDTWDDYFIENGATYHKQLIEDYSDTEYYKQILKECTHLEVVRDSLNEN